jgi:hypothetical protein
LSPITQFDRGTDIVAIRVRRWSFVPAVAMTGLAALIGWTPVTVVLAILAWVWTITVFVWLFLRPRNSPVVEDTTPPASAHKPPPASPPGS